MLEGLRCFRLQSCLVAQRCVGNEVYKSPLKGVGEVYKSPLEGFREESLLPRNRGAVSNPSSAQSTLSFSVDRSLCRPRLRFRVFGCIKGLIKGFGAWGAGCRLKPFGNWA